MPCFRRLRLDDLDTAFPREGSKLFRITWDDGQNNHIYSNVADADKFIAEFIGCEVARCYYRTSASTTVGTIKDITFMGTYTHLKARLNPP